MEFLSHWVLFYFIWPFAAALRASAATFLRRVASLHLLFHVSKVFLFGHRLWNQENQKTGRKWAKICISADFGVRARGFMCACPIQIPGTMPPPRTILFAPANHFVRAREQFAPANSSFAAAVWSATKFRDFLGFPLIFLPIFTLLNPFFFHKILDFSPISLNSSI